MTSLINYEAFVKELKKKVSSWQEATQFATLLSGVTLTKSEITQVSSRYFTAQHSLSVLYFSRYLIQCHARETAE